MWHSLKQGGPLFSLLMGIILPLRARNSTESEMTHWFTQKVTLHG